MSHSVDMEIKLNVTDVNKSLQYFDWIDYVVFMFMLISCAVVGIYFACIDKRRQSQGVSSNGSDVAQEYLMGGRNMSVVPVAMSLVAR